MAHELKPIIKIAPKKSSLQGKKVSIQGNHDFSRTFDLPMQESPTHSDDMHLELEPVCPSKKGVNRSYFKATLTQKISPAVQMKLSTLRPFLDQDDEIAKKTNNEMIDFLIDRYVDTQFTSRQKRAFLSMYQIRLDLKHK